MYNFPVMYLSLFFLTIIQTFDPEAASAETRKWLVFLEVERAGQTRESLENARHYVPSFRKIFKQEGVPEDLVWLALIESGFRPAPRSPTGAQGMFQFHRLTAREFGLKITSRRDERNVPHLAARAAARYLAYLRAKFDSWDLVLAAYNLGEGDLRRAMVARKVHTWSSIKPYLREETQNYVGKVKAAIIIGNRNLKKPNTTQPITKTYRIRKGDTLYGIAHHYGVSVAALKRANGIRTNRIIPGQELIIPAATR